MSGYRVVFGRDAAQQLEDLYEYIADNGSPDDAAQFTEAIITFCENLAELPRRGTTRDDVRPGLRILGYRKRVVIAFAVVDKVVAILGIFYGGRDYESLLTDGD